MKFGEYSSNEETVIHDGTILSQMNIEDIKCNVSFDINIELISGTKFTGNIKLNLPSRRYNKWR